MSPHVETPAITSTSASTSPEHYNMSTHFAPPSPFSLHTNTDFDAASINSSISSIHGRRTLTPGIYVPTVVFFDPKTEDLDLNTIASHAIRLAKAGVTGLTTQGSNGEAVHMDRQERIIVTATTRKALDSAGFESMPIIVGCGAQSVRETIQYCTDAHTAGGDYALILPPSYYKGLHAPSTVHDYFKAVADASPIPVLLYNFPPVAGGTDLSSDDIIELAQHSNIVGCKLTCGNTGKLNRICAATNAASLWENGSGFMCMGGSADFLLQALVGGGSGMIGGFANISPRQCVRLLELVRDGKMKEARELQAIIARGDWAAIQGGIVGTKSALMGWFGYGGYARRPVPRPDGVQDKRWKSMFEECVTLEKVFMEEAEKNGKKRVQ